MKKIAVGIDGSRESFDSFRCAAALFSDEEVEINVIFVVDVRKTQIPFIYSGAAYDITYERIYVPVDPMMTEFFHKLKKDTYEYGEKCLEICRNMDIADNVAITGSILEGEPSEVLRNETENCDLLVIGQRGENSTFKKELIGSTAEDIFRRSSVPVMICPGSRIDTDYVLLVHEGSESSSNALSYFEENISPYSSKLGILIKSHCEEIRESISGTVNRIRAKGLEVVIKDSKGSVSDEALEMIESESVDSIILGAHGVHKLAEHLLGTVTVHIVRKTTRPAFIIH